MEKMGICKLCGQYKKLTFEHVPPKGTFNNHPVRVVNGMETLSEERLPWDTKELKGRIQQKGKGDYYLCESCNNNTGAWYIPYYQEFVVGFFKALQGKDLSKLNGLVIKTKKIRPLPILKQILVMFCDINHDCFGDMKLRDFLMDKENNSYNLDRYKVYIYVFRGSVEKYMGLSGISNIKTGETKLLSEIAAYPIGQKIYVDANRDFKAYGVDITGFGKFKYDDEFEMTIQIPILESNIIFPDDYRSKEEIVPGFKIK